MADPDTAAQRGYAARRARRARQQRAETQGLRHARERRQLAGVLRRELARLADGAGELARRADAGGAAAGQAGERLDARRREAGELLSEADRFGLDLALAELESSDRAALGLSA